MIHLGELIVFAGEQGAPCHHPQSGRFAQGNGFMGGFPLDRHGADKGQIRPRQIFLGEPDYIDINEAYGPVFRDHAAYGDEAEWWECGLFVNEFEGVLKTPESIGKLRVDEKDVQRVISVILRSSSLMGVSVFSRQFFELGQ